VTVRTADLREALNEAFRRTPGVGVRSIVRSPYPYRTSFPLEDLDVSLKDGRHLRLMFKDIGFERLEGPAKDAKARSLHDPLREIEAYKLLVGRGLGTPRLYATVAKPPGGPFWLFIERIDGVPLWQVGERDVWEAAAAWLARLHRSFLGFVPVSGSALSACDVRRSMEALGRAIGHASGGTREVLERIAVGYWDVVDRLKRLPRTLVHGDFHASNILIDRSCSPPRIAPADWEMAMMGPGLLDLASLVSGRWSVTDRSAMVSAYANAYAGGAPDEEFLTDLEACRLHNAAQLLGASPEWTPPPDHAHDWVGEAVSAAERLGIL